MDNYERPRPDLTQGQVQKKVVPCCLSIILNSAVSFLYKIVMCYYFTSTGVLA